MNKNYIYAGVGVFIVFLIIFMAPKYFNGDFSDSGNKIPRDVEKLEIIHFHGNSQCYSCITMGDLAEETINTYFAEELKSGRVTFSHLNGQLIENREKVVLYDATGSSLWFGIYYADGTFEKEQNVQVWYKLGNKIDYLSYLKGVVESKLSGV